MCLGQFWTKQNLWVLSPDKKFALLNTSHWLRWILAETVLISRARCCGSPLRNLTRSTFRWRPSRWEARSAGIMRIASWTRSRFNLVRVALPKKRARFLTTKLLTGFWLMLLGDWAFTSRLFRTVLVVSRKRYCPSLVRKCLRKLMLR